MTGDEIAARARSYVGVRFRPQGRDPGTGMDCVGTAAAAAGMAKAEIRSDYSLRGESRATIEHDLCDLGCRLVGSNDAEPGDIMVCAAGPAQMHVIVFTGTGFVHADAGLRMVVERPCPVPWPVLSIWRPAGDR